MITTEIPKKSGNVDANGDSAGSGGQHSCHPCPSLARSRYEGFQSKLSSFKFNLNFLLNFIFYPCPSLART